jgi:hypothetical protein
MCQLSKVPSTDIQRFLTRIHLKSVSSSVLNMMNDDIQCGSVVFKRSNIANILPLKNRCQINCDSFQIVFKMSFTADECCNVYLAHGAAENNAAFSNAFS